MENLDKFITEITQGSQSDKQKYKRLMNRIDGLRYQLQQTIKTVDADLAKKQQDHERMLKEMQIATDKDIANKYKEFTGLQEKVNSLIGKCYTFNVLGKKFWIPVESVEQIPVLKAMTGEKFKQNIDKKGRIILIYSPRKFEQLVAWIMGDVKILDQDIANTFGIKENAAPLIRSTRPII